MSRKNVRVALVLNGGVSLAVWMGGVTHEVDRLRRSGAGADRVESDAWKRVTEAAQSDVVVDLVAGTSAGGLNGSILASAIARGSALPELRELWKGQGKLSRRYLLHPKGSKEIQSALDGDFFQSAVERALAEVEDGDNPQDVTLLVTSSALYGSTTAVQDARGAEFTAGDHRRIFRFSARKGQRIWSVKAGFKSSPSDDFDPDSGLLQRAARASAGFPFAFAPIRETKDLHALNISRSRGEPSWLVDGGVLDNAPFTPLLEELRDQPCVEPGDRWIVYVVPSVAAHSQPFPAGTGSPPPPWTELPGRLLSLSRESDLRDDVIALKISTVDSRSSVHRPEHLIGKPTSRSKGLDKPKPVAKGLWDLYLRTRAGVIVHEFREMQGTDSLKNHLVTQEEIDSILASDLSWIPENLSPTRKIGDKQCWQWGIGCARRIALWISRDARGATGLAVLSPSVRENIARTDEDLKALQKEFTRIRREAVMDTADVLGGPKEVEAAIRASGLTLVVAEQMEAMVKDWSQARGTSVGVAWERLLGVEVLTHSLSWRSVNPPPPFSLFLVSPNTPHTDTILDLGDEADQRFSPSWPNNKLYGTRLGHFGAFGSTQFRDWDWMWGRLDGALTIADPLLKKAHLSEVKRNELRDGLIKEILQECDWEPEDVRPELARVLALTPGQLVALARDSTETDFDAAIDDIAAMLAQTPLLKKAVGSGWLNKSKASARGWILAKGLNLLTRWAKRIIKKQQPPAVG